MDELKFDGTHYIVKGKKNGEKNGTQKYQTQKTLILSHVVFLLYPIFALFLHHLCH